MLSLAMMVKNESANVRRTFDSVLPFVGQFIILDTGSTDGTVELVREYCLKNNVRLHLTQAPFVDFATSRNVLLEFADDKSDFLLLLDANDELRGGEALVAFVRAKAADPKADSGFYVTQEWYSGANAYDKYFNIRLVRTRHQWRYFGVVHEYIKSTTRPTDVEVGTVPGVVLYQDRTLDNAKSEKRFAQDKAMLRAALAADPDDARSVFYYAQTCKCLRDYQESFDYYAKRMKMTSGGFFEEIFISALECARLAAILKRPQEEIVFNYLRAFSISEKLYRQPRIEPLLELANLFKERSWNLAYMLLRRACELPYPADAILFVNKTAYDYRRWHLMSIVAYYMDAKEEGRRACLRAIEARDLDVDKHNLMTYYADTD